MFVEASSFLLGRDPKRVGLSAQSFCFAASNVIELLFHKTKRIPPQSLTQKQHLQFLK
jgi:hypothetical protein